jgi:hypothetical protein
MQSVHLTHFLLGNQVNTTVCSPIWSFVNSFKRKRFEGSDSKRIIHNLLSPSAVVKKEECRFHYRLARFLAVIYKQPKPAPLRTQPYLIYLQFMRVDYSLFLLPLFLEKRILQIRIQQKSNERNLNPARSSIHTTLQSSISALHHIYQRTMKRFFVQCSWKEKCNKSGVYGLWQAYKHYHRIPLLAVSHWARAAITCKVCPIYKCDKMSNYSCMSQERTSIFIQKQMS